MNLVALRRLSASNGAMTASRAVLPPLAMGLLAIGLAACGSPPGIGAECETNADCDTGHYCLLDVANGYCTDVCDSEDDCPGRSACGQLVPGGDFSCVKLCIDSADCNKERDDDPEDYDVFCTAVGESDIVLTDPDREGRLCEP